MSESAIPIDGPMDPTPTDWNSEAIQRRIRKRYAAERRFRLVGLAAVLMSAAFLAFLLITMMATIAIVMRLDRAWKLVRRASGHEQKSGMLERAVNHHDTYHLLLIDFRNHGQSAEAATTQGVVTVTFGYVDMPVGALYTLDPHSKVLRALPHIVAFQQDKLQRAKKATEAKKGTE